MSQSWVNYLSATYCSVPLTKCGILPTSQRSGREGRKEGRKMGKRSWAWLGQNLSLTFSPSVARKAAGCWWRSSLEKQALINVPTLQLLNPIKMPYSHGPSLTPSPDSCGCFVWAWVGKECLGGGKKKNIFLMNILKIREEEIFKQTWQMCCDN